MRAMAEQRIDAIMETDIVRLRPEMSIRLAVALLVERHTSAAPVVDETGALTGILSQKDCFRSVLNASYYQQWSGTVGEYMCTEVKTLDAATDLVSAAEAFLENPYRAYPVVRFGQLVGMLTRSHLLAAFVLMSDNLRWR